MISSGWGICNHSKTATTEAVRLTTSNEDEEDSEATLMVQRFKSILKKMTKINILLEGGIDFKRR